MSQCCVAEKVNPTESCCVEQPRIAASKCPVCGRKGKAVDRITVEHLLKEDRVPEIGKASYLFCETPACGVVYFSTQPGPVFHKADLRVRVGLKETEAPIPVCYCFGYTERMIFEEIERMGTTTIPDRIRDEIRAGNCRCEVENPRGSCCLGDVGRAVKGGMARYKAEGHEL